MYLYALLAIVVWVGTLAAIVMFFRGASTPTPVPVWEPVDQKTVEAFNALVEDLEAAHARATAAAARVIIALNAGGEVTTGDVAVLAAFALDGGLDDRHDIRRTA